jgi:tetratricopeptide (TPR) repeat protein
MIDTAGTQRLGWRMMWLRIAAFGLAMLLLAPGRAMPTETFPGTHPLPPDTLGCYPLDDRRWSFPSDSPFSFAPEDHGLACLYESRFAEALPKLRKAVGLDPEACPLVELGVAYDGLSRRDEAAGAWNLARRKASQDGPFTLGLESQLLDGDSARALSILQEKMQSKYFANGVYQTLTGPDRSIAEQFDSALKSAGTGHPDEGARIITSLYEQRFQDNGALRYARAVMLLSTDHEREAVIELRLAAILANTDAGDRCVPNVYQWSAVYLLEHLPRN